jgi:DNA-binding MarR family transcriptional regulator
MPKAIKLNGREVSILRSIGFGLGVTGTELLERTQMSQEDLVDILNTLLDAGYAETASMKERITPEEMPAETFEINPSYMNELKEAMKR